MNCSRFIPGRLRSWSRRRSAKGLILLYHRVAEPGVDPWNLCVSPKHFSEHLAVLRNYRPTRLSDLPNFNSPNSIAITFDDGYADNLYCAARLLEHYHIPATFFLTTGYIGRTQEFWWDELERRIASFAEVNRILELNIDGSVHRWEFASAHHWELSWLPVYFAVYALLQPLSDDSRKCILRKIGGQGSERARASHRVLTVEEVLRLSSQSLFEIGAHTVTHSRLAARPLQEQFAEMKQSREFLEGVVQRSVRSFSYPYGGTSHYSKGSVEMARRAGFSMACTTNGAAVRRGSDPFELPRIVIENCDGERFEKILHFHLNNN
jgi:peptidoglycan/xylan/chitin deacetylase (PgdA/CDA1 family)